MIAPNGLRAKLAVHPIATPPTREETREEGEGGGRGWEGEWNRLGKN